MNQRDKNGETASERIARKVFEGEGVSECNTVTVYKPSSKAGCFHVNIILYGTPIARLFLNTEDKPETLRILRNELHLDTRLTRSRKQALRNEAVRRGVKVVES